MYYYKWKAYQKPAPSMSN